LNVSGTWSVRGTASVDGSVSAAELAIQGLLVVNAGGRIQVSGNASLVPGSVDMDAVGGPVREVGGTLAVTVPVLRIEQAGEVRAGACVPRR
jgi:hypothetical protein